MKTLLYRWAKTNSVMLINAGSLVGTSAVTSLLGTAYWWAAARWFTPQAVGLGSAAISAMMLLGNFCLLGLGTLLVGELPRQPGKEGSLISVALIIVGGIGGCTGIVFAVVAPFIATDFQALGASVENIALFASGVSLTAITFVLDQAVIGLLRGEVQFWRNTIFAVIKLAAIFVAGIWLSHTIGLTIYATWALGNVLSLIALAGYAILKRDSFRSTYRPEWGLLRKLGSAALRHHMLNLTLQGPTLALPVLVTIMLSATATAWFYVSWKVVSLVFVVPTSLTTILYAAISEQPAALAQKARLTLSLACVLSMVAACLLLLDTMQVLGVFGSIYAAEAASSLRILTLGAFPIIIKYHYVAVCRIQNRMARATLPMTVGGFLELGMAALGAYIGSLSGLSLGWVLAVCVEAVFMSRTVYKAVWLKGASANINRLQRYPSPHDNRRIGNTQAKEQGRER